MLDVISYSKAKKVEEDLVAHKEDYANLNLTKDMVIVELQNGVKNKFEKEGFVKNVGEYILKSEDIAEFSTTYENTNFGYTKVNFFTDIKPLSNGIDTHIEIKGYTQIKATDVDRGDVVNIGTFYTTATGRIGFVASKEDTLVSLRGKLAGTVIHYQLQSPLTIPLPINATPNSRQITRLSSEFDDYKNEYYNHQNEFNNYREDYIQQNLTEKMVIRELPNGIKDEFKEGTFIKKVSDEYSFNNISLGGLTVREKTIRLIINNADTFFPNPNLPFLQNTDGIQNQVGLKSNLGLEVTNLIWSRDVEGFFWDVNKTFVISLSKTRLDGYPLTSTGVKQYLVDNDVTFIYELRDYEIMEVPNKITSNAKEIIRLSEKLTNVDELMSSKYRLKISTMHNSTDESIPSSNIVYPTLFGIKTDNGTQGSQPVPVGWLYYIDESPYQILYADGTPDNISKLCLWNTEITYNGRATPKEYMPVITEDGDIIFVMRGEFRMQPSRSNPIIYPAGNYDNPFVIEFGDKDKPTAWLQNCGCEYIYNEDCFIFAEYTREVHEVANVWKVSKPFSNPDNWIKTMTKGVGVEGGVKHFHHIQFDPYENILYLGSGDALSECKTWYSTDYGNTWILLMEDSTRYNRRLNMIFTKEKIYWGSDQMWSEHYLLSADRSVDGILDPITIIEMCPLPSKTVTYGICLTTSPNGLLILNRYDDPSTDALDVLFWSFEDNNIHTIKKLYPLGGVASRFGFRCEAISYYESPSFGQAIVGFGHYPNDIDVIGNRSGANINRISNLVLEVY